MKLVYAPRARQDISDIYDSIAADNPASAFRLERLIGTSREGLVDLPFSAPATDAPNRRRRPPGRYSYSIFYRLNQERDLVEIVRVIHGARVMDVGQLPSDEE